MMEYDKHQDIIIKSDNNYTLVVACPGSGKTRTLIYKYINLINNNILPEEIILITFTKKAGNEMNKRILNYNEKIPFFVGSLHGFAYKILFNHKILNNSIIIDETNSNNIILTIINNNNNLQLLDQKDKLKIINIIDKININYPINIIKTLNNNEFNIYNKDIKLVYNEYKKFKKKNNLFDFNDLMVLLCKFLDSDKSIDLKNQIKYIFFDEYQDINPIQQYILNSFKLNSNIILFGDDSQSIYSFRGSSINFILNFKDNFTLENKTLNTYYLINNYRSTPEIINFCQNIINNNNNKIDKKVNTINSTNIKPLVCGFNYKNQEYEWIVNDIIKKQKNEITDIAILSRNNYMLNNIELYLIDNNISYTKQLNNTLLDKKHVKLYIYIIILINNPKNYYYWNLCLDEKNINCIKDINDLNLYNIVINKLYNSIINYLINDKKYTQNEINDINSIQDYLKHNDYNNLFLNQEIENDTNKIFLSTIHGAKGLEWDNVYIIGMGSNIYPNIRSQYYINEIHEIEEERRLLYVGCSRAKLNLILTYHINPSSFITELNPDIYIIKGPLLTYNSINNIDTNIINYLKINGYKNVINLISNLRLEIKKDIINNSIFNKEYNIYINDNIIIKTITNINEINILNILKIILISIKLNINNINKIIFNNENCNQIYILYNFNIKKIINLNI